MATELRVESSALPRRGRALFGFRCVHIAVWALLFTVAATYEAVHAAAIGNHDIWWHLRTGLWILQNHAVPHEGLFSQEAARPWVATSWGFDVLAGAIYKLLGLRTLSVLLMAFRVGIALVSFLLAYIDRRNFWGAVLLSAIAQYAIADIQPLPGTFSLLFFAAELGLLLHSRRWGQIRTLYWLPLIFFVWANLHIQFINGLLLLALFLLAGAAESMLRRGGVSSVPPGAVPLGKVAGVTAVSVLATLLTPYSYRVFVEAVQNSYSPLLFKYFGEMNPLSFRRPQDFVLALMIMGAFVVLGRQRSGDIFKLALLSITALLAFRIQRDGWLAVFAAVGILRDVLPQPARESALQGSGRTWKWQLPIITALVLVILAAAMARLPGSAALAERMNRVFPRKACDFIRANHLPGPLFNDYAWGGFLIWYLPEYPVAMDSRYTLYGNEMTDNFFKTTAGTEPLERNPSFTRARTILLQRESSLAKALANLPVLTSRYRMTYEDDLAVVYVPR
jgi:hypothetical protein